MTGGIEHDGETATPGPAGGKGPWVLVLCVVALLATFGAWSGVARMQRARTSVSWSGPLQCVGSRVTQERLGGTGEPVPTMRLQASMRCRLPVRIENHGWVPVEIERILLPFMGPGVGPAVRVKELDGRPPEGGAKYEPDAVFITHRKLPAGASDTFVLEFTFSSSGCTARGVMWVGDMPTVTVNALGRSGHRGPRELIGFRGTRESEDCSGLPADLTASTPSG